MDDQSKAASEPSEGSLMPTPIPVEPTDSRTILKPKPSEAQEILRPKPSEAQKILRPPGRR